MEFKTSYSGAVFHVIEDTLIKRCRNLYGSGIMQLDHASNNPFRTPKVYAVGEHEIVMDYLKDAITLPLYLEFCTKSKAVEVIGHIVNYITRNNHNQIVNINTDVIGAKIIHIANKLPNYEDIKLAIRLREAFGNGNIPIAKGDYHGDLTFNNILINQENPYLIDFLPGYMPTHWLDVVKIQQEITLEWSKYSTSIKGNNYGLMLNELAAFTKTFYDKEPIIKLMEALNYLRILPYATNDAAVSNVLRNQIKSILK